MLDLVLLFNIRNNLIDIDFDLLYHIRENNLRNNKLNIMVKKGARPLTDLYLNYYTHRVINNWNDLPADVKNAELTEQGRNTTFKRVIKKIYFDMLYTRFDENVLCTWTNNCRCNRCRIT